MLIVEGQQGTREQALRIRKAAMKLLQQDLQELIGAQGPQEMSLEVNVEGLFVSQSLQAATSSTAQQQYIDLSSASSNMTYKH